jgi:hypothetical protein
LEVPEQINLRGKYILQNKELDKQDYWWLKKVTIKILERIIQKYANCSFDSPNHTSITQKFHSEYSVPILEQVLKTLVKREFEYVSTAFVHYALAYVMYSLTYEETFAYLNNFLEKILFSICFPLMELLDQDLENFDHNPQEFIRNQDDGIRRHNNNRNSAIELILKVSEYYCFDQTT